MDADQNMFHENIFHKIFFCPMRHFASSIALTRALRARRLASYAPVSACARFHLLRSEDLRIDVVNQARRARPPEVPEKNLAALQPRAQRA